MAINHGCRTQNGFPNLSKADSSNITRRQAEGDRTLYQEGPAARGLGCHGTCQEMFFPLGRVVVLYLHHQAVHIGISPFMVRHFCTNPGGATYPKSLPGSMVHISTTGGTPRSPTEMLFQWVTASNCAAWGWACRESASTTGVRLLER